MVETFYELLEIVMAENKLGRHSLNGFLNMWNVTIDLCDAGYPCSYIDYLDEISVRDDIQKILNDERLKKFEEYKTLVKEVELLDEKCKSIFKVDSSSKDWYKIIENLESYRLVVYDKGDADVW